MAWGYHSVAILLVLVMVLSACERNAPAARLTPTDSPTAEPTPTLTPTAPPVSTPTPIVVITTIIVTATPQATSTPTATPPPPTPQAPSPTPVPSPTPTPTPLTPTPSPTPVAAPLTAVEVVKILKPSVVQVTTESVVIGLFNQPIPVQGVGTGIILDRGGHVLTNNHVIVGAQRITVTVNGGSSLPATIVGADDSTDLAVIRVETEDELLPAKLGDSSKLEVGEEVVAIGHALGLPGGPTVTDGIVSALNRTIDTDQQITIVDLIETTALINPGNSGGPLVNSRAEVIGITTAIIRGSGLGYAININDAKVVATQLIQRGFVNRGFLGVTPVNLTPGLASQLNLPEGVTQGILVARVIKGAAADRAGLRESDVIVQLGNELIPNTGAMSKFLIGHPPGEKVKVVYFRGETRREAEVTLGERPR
jgi:serine protease Do